MDFFSQVTLLASLAVVVVQEILKLKIVPATFANKYPVPCVIVLSVIAAVVVDWGGLQLAHGVAQWITLIAKILIVSTITYNMSLKVWPQLRAMEG